MTTYESSSVTVLRAALGILGSVALTAGAAMGMAAELQRGFNPVFEAMAERREVAKTSFKDTLPAPAPARSKTAARQVPALPSGG